MWTEIVRCGHRSRFKDLRCLCLPSALNYDRKKSLGKTLERDDAWGELMLTCFKQRVRCSKEQKGCLG